MKIVKHRVVSFPLGSANRIRPAKDLNDAIAIAGELAHEHPLIEVQTVIESDWEIIRDPWKADGDEL